MENEIVDDEGGADHVQGRGRGARGGLGRRAGDRATSVPMRRMRETRWAGRSGRHPASDASGPSAPLRMEGRVPTPSVMSTKTAKGPTVNRKMCSRPILELCSPLNLPPRSFIALFSLRRQGQHRTSSWVGNLAGECPTPSRGRPRGASRRLHRRGSARAATAKISHVSNPSATHGAPATSPRRRRREANQPR